MKSDFELLFLSQKERERRRAEAWNRLKQEQEDEPVPTKITRPKFNLDTLVKWLNANSFLELT